MSTATDDVSVFVVALDGDTTIDVSELTVDSSMSFNNLQSDLAHKKNSNLENKKSSFENVKFLKRNLSLDFVEFHNSIVDRINNLHIEKERLLMNKEIRIPIRNKNNDDDVGGGGEGVGGGNVKGVVNGDNNGVNDGGNVKGVINDGNNGGNGRGNKFVCEACASAGRILSYYFDSDFHPCVLEPVIENFRTKAGPIA